jgi:outer membrane protein OmpA-like peptidoglycan-associated protein
MSVPTRRGSVKGRFGELVEERKKEDAEKVIKIKESRQVEGRRGSIKDVWQQAVNNHKVQENERFEATKESTLSGFRQTAGSQIVSDLIRKFDKIFMQNRMNAERFAKRFRQLKTDTTHNENILQAHSLQPPPNFVSGMSYIIDLTESSHTLEIMGAVTARGNDLRLEVGLFGEEGGSHPPLEVVSAIFLGEDGKIMMPIRIDVLATHTFDSKAYGSQKAIFYLPGTANDGSLGQAILEFDFILAPAIGWEEFHKRMAMIQLTTSDAPTDLSQSHVNAFCIRPVDLPSDDAIEDNQGLSFPPLDAALPPVVVKGEIGMHSPCGSEAVLVTNDCPRTNSSLSDSKEEEDGYLLVVPPAPPSPAKSRGLKIVNPFVSTLLYHEAHVHRLVPRDVLDSSLDLDQRRCVICSLNGDSAHNNPLQFVCPECEVFVCDRCSRRGNGVRGSMATFQIELNSEILFEAGYSKLLVESYAMLEQVGKFLVDNPIPIRIEGHINTVQSSGAILDASNKLIKVYEANCDGQTLSERRAARVAEYLLSVGVNGSLLFPEGCGGSRPLTRARADLNQNR